MKKSPLNGYFIVQKFSKFETFFVFLQIPPTFWVDDNIFGEFLSYQAQSYKFEPFSTVF